MEIDTFYENFMVKLILRLSGNLIYRVFFFPAQKNRNNHIQCFKPSIFSTKIFLK